MKYYYWLLIGYMIITLVFGFSCSKETSKPLYEPAKGPFVKIAISGKANARIIVPSKPTYLEEFAASELQKYFKKMSETEIPILKEDNSDKYSFSFSMVINFI